MTAARFVCHFISVLLSLLGGGLTCSIADACDERPNILVVISDDQSFPHASAYGSSFVETPGFDEVAKAGVLFRNAFAATPGCSPSRASLLAGLHAWQLEHAGTHASLFPSKYPVYPDLLEDSGYHVGYTGKGWGPGNWRAAGRTRNPCGDAFQDVKLPQTPPGISNNDYAGNFKAFLEQRQPDQPFCFWMGGHEPHRGFGKGRGESLGKSLSDVDVPSFLPDHDAIRSDLLDYAAEIEWFDDHLLKAIGHLESIGELDNTLIIVTSDNGMAFPRAKANLYEFGIHVPLAISWPKAIAGERVSDDLVSFVDITATILDATGVSLPEEVTPLTGRSLKPLLQSTGSGRIEPDREFVFATRERHSSSRFRSLGYPQRSVRSERYLLIHNVRHERWPAGAPVKFGKGGYPTPAEIASQTLGPDHGGYHDIDACPTLTWMIEKREDERVGELLEQSVGLRPAYELFDIVDDPGCIKNLADDQAFGDLLTTLQERLQMEQRRTQDPRAIGSGDVFETFARYSNLRYFPEPAWASEMPERVPEMPWWQSRYESILKRASQR